MEYEEFIFKSRVVNVRVVIVENLNNSFCRVTFRMIPKGISDVGSPLFFFQRKPAAGII